jgi:UDP-N-acetylmuramyl pentapeptide synthase
VQGQVRDAYVTDKLAKIIDQKVQDLMDKAKSMGDLEKAAKSMGLEVDDAQSAGGFLETFIRPGDLVLIKASRGIGLDRIVNMLANVEGAH